MNGVKRAFFWLVLLCMYVCLPLSAAAKPAFQKEKVIVYVGQKKALKVNGLSGGITFTSSDKTVATVSKKGYVKGLKAGTIEVVASSGKKSASCLVEVREIHMHRSTRTVKAGGEFKLKLKCGAKQGITFRISNEKVVGFLRQEGNLGYFQGLKAGKTTVKAIYKGKTYKCKVTVKEASPTPTPTPTPTYVDGEYWQEDVEMPMTKEK